MSNFENENDFLAGLKAEFEPAGNKSSNDFLAGLKDEFEPKKPQDGMWETTKAFGRDLAKVPSEISSGFGTTTDQMRMFGNFVQGDREELESLYNGLKNYAPLPESETTVGSWVRGAANTLPYMGMSAAAGIGGGFAGGAAGSVVPFVGNVAGATTGAALGSASVGFAQGWGEMYGRLRNEGIDHDTAAGIALAVAPVYAGIEAVQVRKIPGVAQLVDKYLGAPFKRMLATRLADKAFKNKIAKALGSYAGEIISQSAEEGAQEMAMNTGEQYARNDGFKNFDIGENLAAGTEVFKESVGPFAVMQAGNVPINAVLNRRAKRLQQDISNVQNAVEEGRKSATEEGTPAPIKKPTSAPDGGIDVGGLSNLEVDAANDEIDLQNTAQKNLENPDGKKETSAQSGLDRAQAAALFMQNLQNDPMNVPQGLGLQQEEALLEFMKMRAKLATVQAEKARAEQAKAQEEARLDELAEESLTEAQFERAKENTAKKLADLKPKTNRVAARIERITDPAQRLTAIKEAYEQGNLEKLTDGQLESAWENGADWAEKELSRRTETQNSGTPLLQVMKENGFKLPTPAAIKRHAQANGRGLSSYTFGEINDLYNSLPANQRLRYFTKNYVNLDETAESLKKFGFKYDSEGDFISDVADNLSGQRLSYGFSLAENDFGKMTDAELVEAHRKAEAAKDYSAGFEIKKEWDRRRGYNRDLYHGSPNKNITEFRDESYFTEDKNYARRYKKGEDGRIYEVRANLKKPFDTRNPKEREIFEKEFYGKWGNGTPLGERGLPDWTDGSDLWEFLQEKGYNYDSMVLDEGGDGGYGDNVKWRGESYVPIKSSAVKLRDAFTYGDDGKYIPLDKRSDASNPDIRYSIGEDDARRFKSELQDYIDGKLDNRHVFKLGTTPEVMRLVGADDLPVELSASVLERKEAKHSLILENLANLPEELADPIAVMQSSTIPDAITLITELPTLDRHNMLVAIHLNKRFGKAEINSIRSIYPKTQNGIQAAIERGELRYINTKRKPSWITLPFQHASGRKVIQRAYGHEVFTQADLSQAEKENIFKLRGENEKHAYSISERGNEKQAKIDEIKTAVEEVLEKFNRRAKIKSDVSVVGTLDEARAELGAESIPYNARAVQSGDKVVIIAENITDTDEAVRIFLHEQVGHWGLHKLLKADLRPFLNYVILNYKGSEAWNRIAKYYGNVASDKYVIAEEMLAHIAENRELSDPSMWKRLVHKVKRELWGNGVPQEYVNLLNEDVLRAAIALSREWAKGDHYLNANGIWAKIESAPKGRDVPDEPDNGKRFSLVGEKGMQNLENIGSKSASNPESAKEMSERGETPSNIWRKTGWFKNPKDGKWRYELDNGEIINAPFEENSNQLLPNVLDDNDLYSAYPSLKNKRVIFRDIVIGDAYFDGKNFYVNNSFADSPKGLRELLIHEIQHYIQNEEGFEQGANESMFTSENSKFLNWMIEKVSREYDELQVERKRVSKESGLSEKIREIADDDDFVEKYEKFLEESGVKEVLAELDDKIFQKSDELWKLREERDRLDNEESGLSPHEKYMRVAGEVEARNAAARQMQLSPDMRRKIFPEETQDIPFDEQIVRRNDGVSYSLKEEPTDAEIAESQRQRDEVKAKWTNPDGTMKKGYHLTPNGKESKLTEEQWLWVRTPNFKKWFGDWENDPENASKVVDENGEPLVVYHGSTAMFNEFRSEYIGRSTGTADGRGFYFTTDKSYAKAFKAQDGRVIEAFLNIRDTLDHRKKTIKKAALKKIIKEIDRAEFEADGGHYFISNFDNYLDKGIDKTIDTATESNYDFCDTDVEILNVLVNSGVDFDSTAKAIKDITGKDGEIVPKDNNTTHFIVFNSNQIKDAVGNVGTFSENPDIRYSISEDRQPYDGRFGDANRKYTRLLGQKRRELGREIPYEELPNVATDEEFEKAVGMSKQAFGDLMKERDKMGADMAYEYQKTDQRTKQATVDRFNPIKVVEMFINGGEAFGAEKSAYKSLLAAGNMDAVMYNAIYVGLPKYNRKKGQWEVREGTKPLIAYFDKVKGDKYDNFENYANAVAMLEHYKREHKLETISDAYKWADDKEFEAMSGFTKQQAKKWMEEATKDSKDTVKALQEFFAANREFMVETGLASRAQADVLNSFEYYLPMLREFDENDSIMSGDGSGYRSRGFSGRSSGVKNFTGSRRKTKNVMESIIERTAALYANGYKNIAMQRSIQMLSEFGLARHAEKSSEIVKARISCAKAALEKAGVQVGEVHDESELIPLEAFHITNSLDERIRDDIVSVRANGRLIFYKINDPELLVALKSLGQEQMNVLTQWLIGAKNVMTWGVTKLPAFAIRNFLRDTGANAVLLGNNPVKSVANFAKALKDTPQMQNIRMSGFGGAVWYPVSAKGVSTDFGGGAWKKTKRVGKYVLKPFEAYERVLQASEQANRITAYDRAIADGVSEAEAAYRANDVLPFNMRGSGVWTGKNNYAKSGIQILSWLIRVSPFVNAGIQGLFKAYREMGIERGMFNAKDEFTKRAKMRELAKSLNKGLMARGVLLAALSVAYSIYTNSSTDDDGEKWYEKLPDDDKLNYWHFYTGNNTILRLPKPFEIGYLFSTIPTAMADAFLSENPDTAKILFKGLVDQMRFDLTSNPAINTVKENLRNKTSFRGSPVVERSDLNLPPQMQYSADTSATAKALSIIPSMLPLLKDSWAASPARVQNALNNFFGGMSQYGTYATDAILQSFTDIEQPTSRYARISPITRAYDWATRDTKTMRVKNSEVFYELKNRVDELYAAARMYRQTGQLERLDALMDTHKSEFGNYELINALNTQLREIATKRRKLGETKSYSTAELIELDNKLLAERNQLLQKVDTIIERIERGEYRPRDLREVTKRIDRSASVKKDSQKARMLMRQLE